MFQKSVREDGGKGGGGGGGGGGQGRNTYLLSKDGGTLPTARQPQQNKLHFHHFFVIDPE